jgi:hypothetical protein
MKNVLIGSLFLAMGCGGNNVPEVSSVSFNTLGFTGDGMQFAFFTGPVTELVDTDFDGVDDAEKTQLIVSLSNSADYCSVLALDPNANSLTELKLATLRVFIQGDIGTTAPLVVAGATLALGPNLEVSAEVLVRQAGEDAFRGISSVFSAELQIDELSGANMAGSLDTSFSIDLVSQQFISGSLTASILDAAPCEALSFFFR